MGRQFLINLLSLRFFLSMNLIIFCLCKTLSSFLIPAVRTEITQPVNTAPQEVPRTSTTNVPRTSPKRPICKSRGRQRTSPSDVLRTSPSDVPGTSRSDVLRTSLRGPSADVFETLREHLSSWSSLSKLILSSNNWHVYGLITDIRF